MKIKQLFCIIALSCLTMSASIAQAQQMPSIPIDPDVRIGKLDNGLTYYIRKNALPENRADFYIAQKVGSIQETPEQSGLAHFLEHMCFNGTTHFPGDALKQYLESIGVKFGINLNAYTSIDETVYNINDVPMDKAGALDSCLLILHDWSNDLTLDPVEIDKERGVIHEEWRSRRSAMQRLQEKALPQMFAGTKYEDCMPIGHMEVVLNFKPETLRDYYEMWYRPDLQGIIVVGDVDVDDVEQKIKTLFSDIPAQPNAPERIYYPVNNNEEPIIVIEQDKEQSQIQVLLFNKHEAVPDSEKTSIMYLASDYMKSMISSMLNNRLSELRQSPNPPFIVAGAFDGMFFVAKTMDSFTGYAICKEGEIETGISALVREIERAHRFGFTASEYDRARADYLTAMESAYNERDKRKNNAFVNEYVRHFLDNEPTPGIEMEYTIATQLAPNIPIEAINGFFGTLVSDNNQVLAIFGPEKEGIVYPTKEEVAQILKTVKHEELSAYEDKVSDEPLIASLPTPGKIVKEETDQVFGTTIWTLSNGATVYLKPTDFKADQILMTGTSEGGTSLFDDSEVLNFSNINAVTSIGGWGNFSSIELNKALSGKKASLNSFVNDFDEGVNGNSTPKDFETLLQLNYLAFTAPRKDSEAFESYKNRTKAGLANQELQPMSAFADSINSTLFYTSPRVFRMKANMVDQIDYDRVLEMYADRFMDAGDFTFVFVGNIDPETAKPLVEQYIASLPTTGRKETFKDVNYRFRDGITKNVFTRKQETAKATNLVFYHGKCEYTLENKILMSMLDQIMNLVYTEKVREDEGGTYGVGVAGGLTKKPLEQFTFQIFFETAPEKREVLMKIIFDELEAITTTPPSESNLSKVKEYMLKKNAENQKENNYWLGAINEYAVNSLNNIDEYRDIVNRITAQDISDFARKLLVDQKNEIEVSMISPAENE